MAPPHAGPPGGQQGRKRARPPPSHQQPEEPHFVYTLFPGTATLEAYLTPYVVNQSRHPNPIDVLAVG